MNSILLYCRGPTVHMRRVKLPVSAVWLRDTLEVGKCEVCGQVWERVSYEKDWKL